MVAVEEEMEEVVEEMAVVVLLGLVDLTTMVEAVEEEEVVVDRGPIGGVEDLAITVEVVVQKVEEDTVVQVLPTLVLSHGL
jgi:hypothetical protein